MSKNKLAKFAEMETFPHVFQFPAKIVRNEDSNFEMQGKWNEKFFGNSNPIVLELGCGKGEYTVGMAEIFPEKNFIGVDIKGARMWRGAKYSFEKKIPNVAFLRTRIEMLHYFFGENEISEIWLTFPDPQMKKITKRLTSSGFLKLYSRFTAENALIHLKTDSNFLFTYTMELLKLNHFPIEFSTDNLYEIASDHPILSIKTFYEEQWIERGIPIKYIEFKLEKRIEILEPEVEIEHDQYKSFGRRPKQETTKN